MAFDFAQAKLQARRVVHSTFGVQAFYKDASIDVPVEIRARWHNRTSRPVGDLENGGYAEVIEGIDRIVLIPVDTKNRPVTLQRNGIVTVPTLLPGVEFNLEHKEPADGPLEEAWVVTRK
jgi:hypothetical protein